jgi:hypothetical protein
MELTLKKAVDVFLEKNPEEMSKNSNCIYDKDKNTFYVTCMGKDFEVIYPDGNICNIKDKDEEVPLIWEILILHYLAGAKGTPLQEKMISFKELPGGSIYIDPFNKRTLKPLLKIFGNCPEMIIEIGKKFNGKKSSLGDYSITINAFPNIPITYVIWEGDDEFPPSGNVLFDASAPDYLHTEDYAYLASFTVYEMAKKFN